MKSAITALVIRVEETTYDDEGRVTPRKPMAELVAFESQIPPEVEAWVRSLMGER